MKGPKGQRSLWGLTGGGSAGTARKGRVGVNSVPEDGGIESTEEVGNRKLRVGKGILKGKGREGAVACC